MARPRSAVESRSAAGRLLDADAFAAASRTETIAPPMPSRVATQFRKRQVILDDTANDRLERMTAALRRATGTRLTTSHALRALLLLIEPAIDELGLARAPIESMYLPNNAPRFDGERRRFESALAALIRDAWAARRV
jgi:hypothetical protein